ncbi:MAG: epoxide hydrolase [Alphaproteobacteria bacterium HGW-Alphaproteobacteria-11]|nr:MAG: epoxide hydrolase [Alphaproteobacteria bacterium HGW-Alphaproteobacteria-11]
MNTHPIRTAYIEANGLAFEVDICGDGEKLALLLHGFPESKYSWRHQMPVFAELGYTVWAPNLRGYGGTSRPKGREAYALPHLLDDVAGLIDAARARGVSGPTTLVSHDWGGVIAWTFALKKMRPLERFIVMNLPHPALMAKRIRTWAQLKKSWYIFFFQIPWLPEKLLLARNARAIGEAFRGMAVDKSRFPEEVLDHYRKNAQLPGAMTAMINYYRASFRGERPAEWTDPPMLETPTLMIWGEEDSALGKELTYGTDELVSDFTIRYLPQVSHWVQQEAPESVNAMIRAWIEGRHVPQAGLGGRLLIAD